MPSKHIITQIDGNKVKLSNLDKMIYPYSGHIKAEVIQYYKDISPYILKYIHNRPLTLIRYPDGIEGTRFYAKDKPKWAPQWVQSTQIVDDDNHYILASRTCDVVWIANLAGLEIHPMQIQAPEFDHPDHFIFDLDPSPGYGFDKLKELAFLLRAFLIENGYHPFVKTSGSKGIHIYVPIIPDYDHVVFIASIKSLARAFVQRHPKMCTLKINKEKRVGKVLLDIYRNHRSNSCVAPYSLRAKQGAPVSMPIDWEELARIETSQHFKMGEVLADLEKHGDRWEHFFDHAVGLHDQKKKAQVIVDSSLKTYDAKRNFEKTSEPRSELVPGNNDQFVIQLHNASNLHYDLRLEYDGVLLSWAIPKAIPSDVDEKRLAIRTEDHPVKYLNFEGKIPKNEYGGGEMWVFDRGQYTMHKKEEKKLQFTLNGKYFRGKFNIFNTKGDQWLLSKDQREGDIYLPEFEPMLAGQRKKVPTGDNYVYEVKWDGLRALFYYEKGDLKIISRSGSDLTSKFPEFQHDIPLDAQMAVLDGEIVVLDEKGVSDFPRVISRMHTQGKTAIERASKKNKAVFYAYDILYLDGRNVCTVPFYKRHAWLSVIMDKNFYYRISDLFPDGKALFAAGKTMGLEGIMAKQKEGRYMPGDRNDNWIKVKYRENLEAYIIGYTEGTGDRSPYFGSLHLAQKDGKGNYVYIGRVGSGFDSKKLTDLKGRFAEIPKSVKIVKEKTEEEIRTTWIQPVLRCEVQFASWTKSKTMREPVFVRLLDTDS